MKNSAVHVVALAFATCCVAPAAFAEPPAPPVDSCNCEGQGSAKGDQPASLEAFALLGPSVVFGEPANPEYAGSFRRVGGYGALGVAYRSRYFVDPFIMVGYASLASGEARLPDGPWGPGGTLDESLSTWVITPGLTTDIWRFRLRWGLGVAIVKQTFSFGGSDTSTSQTPLANQVGIGFVAFDRPRFRLDGELDLTLAAGADLKFLTANVVARGDVITF